MKLKLFSVPVLLAAVAASAVLGAGSARAGSNGRYTADCPATTTVQPFLPWLDLGHYFLGPSGAFEGDLSGWTVKGGAQTVAGNEPYYVNSARDSRSLSLPSGSSVTTPPICVTLDSPTCACS